LDTGTDRHHHGRFGARKIERRGISLEMPRRSSILLEFEAALIAPAND